VRIPGHGILVLDTHLTDELRDEGTARDLVNQIQQIRKQLDLRYEQRIDLSVVGEAYIQQVVNRFADYIRGETLANCLLNKPLPGAEPIKVTLDDHYLEMFVRPVRA